MVYFDIITIFPKMFHCVLNESIVKRAQQKRKVSITIHDLRDFTEDKHRKVDDRPFGGGPGMVMRPEPLFSAVRYIRSKRKTRKSKVVFLTPQGRRLNQQNAKKLFRKHTI